MALFVTGGRALRDVAISSRAARVHRYADAAAAWAAPGGGAAAMSNAFPPGISLPLVVALPGGSQLQLRAERSAADAPLADSGPGTTCVPRALRACARMRRACSAAPAAHGAAARGWQALPQRSRRALACGSVRALTRAPTPTTPASPASPVLWLAAAVPEQAPWPSAWPAQRNATLNVSFVFDPATARSLNATLPAWACRNTREREAACDRETSTCAWSHFRQYAQASVYTLLLSLPVACAAGPGPGCAPTALTADACAAAWTDGQRVASACELQRCC